MPEPARTEPGSAELVALDDHRPKPRRGGNKKGTRRSFGNIRSLPSGRVQASYLGPDGKRHTAETTFLTKGDADTWLALRNAEITEHRWKPPAPKKVLDTFGEYADRWLAGAELTPRTRVEYRRLLNKQILPRWADVPLIEITSVDVKAWYRTLSPEFPTRRAHTYSLLHTILAAAIDDELLTVNPARIKGASSSKRKHKIRPASVAELDMIMESLPPRLRLMAMLGAWTALRFGELAELRRKDIDLDGKIIRVDRAVTWVKEDGDKHAKPVIGKTKTKAGQRDVTIPPHLIPMIKKHLDEHAWPGEDGLLFYSLENRSMQHSTFYDRFLEARKAAGREDLRLHDLRHTGMTLFAIAGATTAELMQRAGHSTPQAAMIYQHVVDGRQAELANKLSEFANADK